ncbi:hypothetical protein CBOM_05402 [Ceraceosorus bombacis]|uniref:Uncharacterized protein n=1 Tax=Ceraceosorus bombacis TaxID=401625 RepID=A0A0P1BRY6_9BASI|nr:hypothetical protein CBOM_05402 [Ceraceosorus bombacis]
MDDPGLQAPQAPGILQPPKPRTEQLYGALSTEAPRRLHSQLLRLCREEGIYFVESFVGDLREFHDSNLQMITTIEMSRTTVNAVGPMSTSLRPIRAKYNKIINIINARQRAARGWRALSRRESLDKVGEAAFWAALGSAANITYRSLMEEGRLPNADRVVREVCHDAFKPAARELGNN